MNKWQQEVESQNHFGRSQLEIDSVVGSRPFGVAPSYEPQLNGQYSKPRQFGGGFNQRQQQNSFNGNGNSYRENGSEAEPRRISGHLAFLKSLQRSGAVIRIVTILDEEIVGSVKDCDETTISLRVPSPSATNPDAYQNRVFIKQNIVEFAPVIDGVTFS